MKSNKTIGIVGQGFVGTAIREKFKECYTVNTYDKFNEDTSVTYIEDKIIKDNNTIESLVKNNNIIFICVPTPMFEDGECDTSIVKSVINDLADECDSQDKEIIAIVKSTIPPGTTKDLNRISKRVGVVFSPEFLTEANSIEDFKNQTRIVLGIDYAEHTNPVYKIFKDCFPNADIICINSGEAEMTKYTTNLFLATKVSFFNDIYKMCESLSLDYDHVIEATMHDPRIGKSHYMVPGPDGDLGYGGHCFPKDMQAILYVAAKYNLPVPTLVGAHTTNMLVRKDKDWEKMEGRAVSKRNELPELETIEDVKK